MKRHFYFPLLPILFLGTTLAAQVTLSGALTGSYATLTAAFTAINNGGGTGTVTATITADHTLTTTAALNQTNYTVNVVPSGIRVVSGDMNNPLVRLNGADNVNLDGMNTAANKLTFSNSNTGAAASAIQLQADASGNTVKNCILEGSSTGQFDNGVLNIKAISGSTGCDNNTVMGNEIKAAGANLPRNGICMAGLNGSVLNNNNTISNNSIRDFFTPNTYSVGFFSVQYNYGTQITGNSFYQTATRTGSGADLINRPIEVDDGFYSTASGGFVISGNFIGGTAPMCAGTAYTLNHPTTAAWFEGIYMEGGPAAVNSIQGNTIKNISTSSAFGTGGNWDAFTGMDLRGGGSYNVGTTTGNVIGAPTGTGSISITQNFTSGATTHTNGIRNLASGTVAIKNNTLGSITTTMTGTVGYVSFYGIYSRENDNITIEQNTVGGTTANSIQFANAAHDASLHGIMIEDFSGSILNNTVQNLTSNARVELNGIMLWNNNAGKTQTCTGNTVKNLSTTTGSNLDVTGILAVSNSASSITYSLNISGNTIMDCSVAAAATGECDLFGIWIVPRGSSSIDFVNGTVSDNTITGFTSGSTSPTAWLGGIIEIQLYNGSGIVFSGNTISSMTSVQPFNFGIAALGDHTTAMLPSATSLTMQQNTIHTLVNNKTGFVNSCGICFNGKNITVARNKIYGFTAPSASGSDSWIAGISCAGVANSGDYSASNNMVSLGGTVANDIRIAGFQHDLAPTTSLAVLYNSVFIGGAAPGGAIYRTTAFDRQVTTTTTLRDNIFYNARTGGTGGHYAIANTASPPATGWSGAASNYNYLVSAATGTVGLWGTAPHSFSGWQTASGGDGNSVTGQAGVTTNPANFFINTATGDLSINTANYAEASAVQNIGTPVSVTVDFFGTTRSATTPDIGAHEFPTVPPPCTASISGPAAICSGQTATLTASSVPVATAYAWSTGATTASITVSTAGTYLVTVTATGGCTATASHTLTVNPLPNAAITPSGPTTFSAGGSVVLTASGGGTYAWSTGASTAAITVSTGGTYVVTVTGSNGCTATASQVVTVNPNPTASISPNGPTTFCAGGSVVLTASGGGTYAWSTGATTPAITVSTTGNYVVTVTNSFGCTASASQTVTVNPLPNAAITPSGPTTFCDDGSVTLTASGGGTYAWSTGETTAAILVVSSGTFTVTVTGTNGCTATASQVVVENPNPTPVITPSGPTAFCTGGSVTLTASGGTSYAWSTGATTPAITVSSSGNYIVTVTNSFGCTASASQVVTVTSTPSASIAGPGAFCAGQSATLTAASVPAAISYLWSTGATTASITVSSAGTYVVTVTATGGCTGTASKTVTVNPLPSASISPSGPTTFCAGGSVTLTASGGGTYAWSTGASTAAVVASTSGTYVVTVTGANGCTASASQAVAVNPAPSASISPSGPTSFCAGGSVTLTASGGGTYTWSTGATTPAITVSTSGNYIVTVTGANGCTASASQAVTVTSNPVASIAGPSAICSGQTATLTASSVPAATGYLWSTGATTASITVSAGGTYVVTVTATGGCTGTASKTVTVNANPTAAITPGGPTTFSAGGSVTLTASGGTSYAWSTGASTAAITVGASGTYVVTVTNASGCTATASQAVTVNQAPAASISGPTSICPGQTATLTASSVPAATGYLWSTGATTASITASSTGTYTVTVTAASGCTGAASRTLSATDPANCDGDNDGYTPAQGDCNDSNPAIHPGATEVCFNAADDNCNGFVDEGCNPCSVLTATLPACRTVYIGYAPAASTTLTPTVNGGVPPYTYAWSNGAVTPSITVSPTSNTTYTVTVSDNAGCTATASTLVESVNVMCNLPGQPVKIYVCHNNGNGTFTTLCVAYRLVAGHLAHGDKLGQCGVSYCQPFPALTGGNPPVNLAGSGGSAFDQEVPFGNDNLEEQQVSLFPNPASGAVSLSVHHEFAEGGVEVFDLQGRLVMRRKLEKGTPLLTWRTDEWRAGVYLVKTVLDGEVFTQKLVVE